mmetsp:Transcript_19503/g.17280  ORF Transcript_19503/g.17280 Transcript_19503/m.17280 type:complete len:301 (+) Transcript_19503:108-1010(+)
MCGVSCCISACGKLGDYIDSNFESMYLKYIQARSYIAHHQKTYQSIPPSTSKSIQLVIATILAVYGGYFTWFITAFTAYPMIKLLAWSPMNEWFDKVKQLFAGTDRKLRLDQEIVEYVEQQAYSDGIALYLSKTGIVRKFLGLMIAECESEILWGLFRVILVTFISIYLVFWSVFIRDLMLTVFIYGIIHDILFQSYLFHSKFYESFQSLFEGQFVHWSKIMVEIQLFISIFIYIQFVEYIAGSFAAGISITLACYLVVRNTVTKKYELENYGNAKSEIMNIIAWTFFFAMAIIIQWRLF